MISFKFNLHLSIVIQDTEKENLLRTATEEGASSVDDDETSLSQAATRGESEGGKYSQDALEGGSSEGAGGGGGGGGNGGRGIMMVNAMVSGELKLVAALITNI